MKKIVKINEGIIKRMVAEALKKVLNESLEDKLNKEVEHLEAKDKESKGNKEKIMVPKWMYDRLIANQKKNTAMNESRLRKIVAESARKVLMEMYPLRPDYSPLMKAAWGVFDYMYNEGVYDYDMEHLISYDKGTEQLDYIDVAKTMLDEYGEILNDKDKEEVKNFINGNTDTLKGIIDKALKGYLAYCMKGEGF